jgi:hypothetical protein
VPGTISEAIAQFAWWAAPPWGDQGVVMRNIKTQVPGTFIVRSPKINKCGSVYVAPMMCSQINKCGSVYVAPISFPCTSVIVVGAHERLSLSN